MSLSANDRIYLAIISGEFRSLSNATQYANEFNLLIEFKRSGPNGVILMKRGDSGWIRPSDWASNYIRKVKIQRDREIDRYKSLGIDSEPDQSINLLDLRRVHDVNKDMNFEKYTLNLIDCLRNQGFERLTVISYDGSTVDISDDSMRKLAHELWKCANRK